MLNLQDLNDYNKTMHRPLFIKIIEGFISDLANELLPEDHIIDQEPITEGLIQAYSHGNEWGEYDSELTEKPIANIDYYFKIKLYSTCKYKLYRTDEREVGLNNKGELEDAEDIEHEIKEIKFYILDNEFDLTEDKTIREKIIKMIW